MILETILHRVLRMEDPDIVYYPDGKATGKVVDCYQMTHSALVLRFDGMTVHVPLDSQITVGGLWKTLIKLDNGEELLFRAKQIVKFNEQGEVL